MLKLEKGDRFTATIKLSDRSKTLDGVEKAGTLAYGGKVFTVTSVEREPAGIIAGDFCFLYRHFTLQKKGVDEIGSVRNEGSGRLPIKDVPPTQEADMI